MVEQQEIKFLDKKDKDLLFKSAMQLSQQLKEEIDSSTFITVGDAISTGSAITIFKNLPEDKSNILRDFRLK